MNKPWYNYRMRAELHEPKEYHENGEGVLVVAPYPLGGRPRNTRDRIAETARQAGVNILAWQASGTGRYALRDMARRAITPQHFKDTCGREIEQIRHHTAGYDHTIGWGDSRAATNIMHWQLCNPGAEPTPTDKPLFSRLLLRDGINFKPGDQLKRMKDFFRYDESAHPLPPGDIPPDMGQKPLNKLSTAVMTLGEIANYSALLASCDTLECGYNLACNPELPLRFVGVSHSFSDPENKAADFYAFWQEMREDAGRATRDRSYAELRADIVEGGHAQLMRPALAAQHIIETLDLQTLIAEQWGR